LEIHFVFGYSAAGSIRKMLGHQGFVVRFSDDLSYGPINPPHPATRRAWIEEHLGFDNPDISEDENSFWPLMQEDAVRVAWVSRRTASEYCGFLEYLRRLGDRPTKIIDTTDARDADGLFFRGTASIPANYILSGLLKTARALDASFRNDCLILWEALCTEGSNLRAVDRSLTLSSVPLSFYDEKLLSLATQDWQPMVRIVGELLPHIAVNDLLLISRVYALVDAGMLAARETDRPLPDVRLGKS
jgi:hypothetical protein